MPASAGTTAAAETMARGPSKRPKFSSENVSVSEVAQSTTPRVCTSSDGLMSRPCR